VTNQRKGDSMAGIGRNLVAVLGLAALLTVGIVSSAPAAVTGPPSPYVTDFSARTLDEAGNDDTVAGDHPFEAVTSFVLPAAGDTGVPVKSVFTELPAGFVANVGVVARCMVGTLTLRGAPTDALYNMVPERGYPAELGANVAAKPIMLYARLRPRTGQYGVTVASPGITIQANVTGATVALFGIPSQANGTGGAPVPFMTDPANCQEAEPSTKLIADSWEFPGRLLFGTGSSDFGEPDPGDPTWRTATAPAPPVTGCDSPALASQFSPTIDLGPTPGAGSSQAETPSGYTVDLNFPQTNDPTDSSSTFDPSIPGPPPLKDATVTLPAGVAISPSAADGLGGCSDQASDPAGDQVHYETTNPVTCPEASKIGTVVATSPLLAQRDPETDEVIGPEPIGGSVFILKPHPGDLSPAGNQDGIFRLLIEVSSAKYGIDVKLPGIVRADKNTGQLTATFLENPQLPVKHLELKLKPGPRAALANPSTCGTFTTTSDLVPWSTPGTPDATPSSSFAVSSGANGGACASTPGQRPFGPALSAGTESSKAGASTPFVLHLTRNDGEQELSSIGLITPKGFAAKLAGVPYCSESAIAAASSRSGAAELASPSCPAASQVGSLTTGAGPGSNPYYVNGKAYLAGPYKGAPLSMVFITPAVAGPFDLGNVVVRAALEVNPETAQVTVKTDPLPQMLDGVPLRLRSVTARIDRSDFTLNPTNCERMAISASLGGSSGATASSSVPFQVGECNTLAFKPKLTLSLKGSTKHAGHPALKAVLTYPQGPGYANIARAQVNLPHSEFIDQANLNKTCTKPVLLAGNCPAKSIYGKAKAWTPLLEKPLEGPVYLVGGYGYKLPALVADLNGQIRVVLKGKVDSGPNHGIRNTFEAVPDAPVEKFVLEMKGGPKYSLLENSENLCAKPQKAIVNFTAQNGMVENLKPTITNSCGKKKKQAKTKSKSNGAKRAFARISHLGF
jgi:hypothetical protein